MKDKTPTRKNFFNFALDGQSFVNLIKLELARAASVTGRVMMRMNAAGENYHRFRYSAHINNEIAREEVGEPGAVYFTSFDLIQSNSTLLRLQKYGFKV